MGYLSAIANWRSKYVRGGLSVFAGDGYQHALRLAANLIMTRLLYPEAFGIMLIVNTFLTGIQLFSNIGIRGAVILYSKKHEDESKYLHVVWTIQAIRGICLFLIAAILSYPLSLFYEQEILVPLILISSLNLLILGFQSPLAMAAERDIRLGRLMLINAASQTLSLAAIVALLYFFPVIYFLAVHNVIQALLLCGLSYGFLGKWRPRFSWDKEIASGVFNYGGWVLLSTIITFLANQGDRLVLSKLLSSEALGMYAIALNFAFIVNFIMQSLGRKLLFPVYAEFKNNKNGEEKIYKVRALLAFACLLPILFLTTLGDWMISLLYDDRYAEVGWMLQVIAFGTIFSSLSATLNPVLLATGNSKHLMLVQLFRFFILFACFYIGYRLAGTLGLMVAISVVPIIVYPVSICYALKSGVKKYYADLIVILVHCVAVWLIWSSFGFLDVLKSKL